MPDNPTLFMTIGPIDDSGVWREEVKVSFLKGMTAGCMDMRDVVVDVRAPANGLLKSATHFGLYEVSFRRKLVCVSLRWMNVLVLVLYWGCT